MLSLIILSLIGVVVLFMGFMKRSGWVIPVSILAVVLALAALLGQQNFWNHYLMDMVQTDGSAKILTALVLCNGLALLPFYSQFKQRGNEEMADFLGLILFSLVGAALMVSSTHFMSLFIGVEILSISMYILAGADRRKIRSNEAALKYFITGSFTSALMLFGIGLLYAVNGSLAIHNPAHESSFLSNIAYLFLFTAFALKVAVVPFHFWSPDVYEVTTTLFTALMASLVKVASVGAFFRIVQLNHELFPDWMNWYFAFLILLTLIFGNLFALQQRSAKRLLAYSGIVQAGFILMGFIELQAGQEWPILYYFVAYVLASLVCFIVVHFVETNSGTDDLDAFAGLSKSNPTLAWVMTIALVSLAGGPLTAGFVGKIFMLEHAIQHGFSALVVIAVICTLLSVYYYYRIVNAIFSPSADQKWSISFLHSGLLILFTLCTLAAGIVPEVFNNWLR